MGGVLTMFMSTAVMSMAHRRFAVRPGSRTLLDFGIMAAALAGTLAQIAHSGFAGPLRDLGEIEPLAVALAVCSTAPLVAWRRFPYGVFVITAMTSVLLAGTGHTIDLLLGPSVALYLLAASRSNAAPWTRQTTLTVVGLLAAYMTAAVVTKGSLPGIALSHTGLMWAVAWFAGERTRLVREQIAELRERAQYTEREAQNERRIAAAEERARIARDLHDSAAHAINVIAVHAGTARLRRHEDPERALQALEVIEDLARQTAGEIDQIVGTLREASPDGVEAPPGVASLETLIEDHGATGLIVTLTSSGSPVWLSRAADQAVYRILQEALTNAARHGAGNAAIKLVFDSEAVELTVSNPILNNAAARSGGGYGVVGMQERASMLGGQLSTERSSRSFRLRARIPTGGRRA